MSRTSGLQGRRRQRQASCAVGIACSVYLAATPALLAQDDGEIDVAAVSQRIDQLLKARLREAGARPAPLAGDIEFLRRAYLDLSGVIPPAADILAFQADERPDKRARAIDRLLANPRFGTHLAQVWTKMLLPADALTDRADQVAGFTAWLRRRFAENLRYDNVVADLLTTTGNSDRGGAALFYTASGLKPEELASSTSRIFLGVQIQCAQCHNHPFDRWQQEDFWGYAAFFAPCSKHRHAGPCGRTG